MTQSSPRDTRVSIASDYTTAPGFRFRQDGPKSGEEFRETFLEPYFRDPNDSSVITINLDGVAGYATSFLEEAFGGLARRYGVQRCLARLRFISVEDPLLKDEVRSYIEEAK